MKRLLCALLAAVFCAAGAAVPDRNAFVPDLSTSDIYLPHLKRIPLSGWWYLKKVSKDRKNDPNDAGTVGKFFDPNLDDSQWPRDLVPNDIHVPFLMKLPKKIDWGGMIQALYPHTSEWGGVAWFRKSFTAPAMKKDERAILTFEEICGDITLYVNGKKIGQNGKFIAEFSRNINGPHRFDITSAIIPGKKNVIAIRFYMSGEPRRWCWSVTGGLTGLVYMDVRPAAYTENILATTEADLSTVTFESILSGSTAAKDTDGWTGEVFEWKSGKKAATVKFGKAYTEDGLRLVSGKVKIPNAKCWHPETPFLYGIRVKNSRGEVAGIQRFGVRRMTVGNRAFLLNGKPIALRGMVMDGQPFPMHEHGWFYAFRTNPFNVIRNRFKMFTEEAAVNHIRTHSSSLQRGACDILDELGVIITDELSYPTMRIKSTRSDMIDVKGFDGACEKNGKLRPEFIAKTKNRIRSLYSHPSICLFSFGNEIRQYDDPKVEKLLNNLYDLYHKVDKQKRPTTNSSGRFWKDSSNVREMHEREKLDYIDTHDYTGSINNMPLAFCEPVARNFVEVVRKHYGTNYPPIINGETVYMADHYYGLFNDIWKNENDLQPNWDKMLYMLEKWRKDHPEQSFLSYYWVRNWGSKNYKFHRPEGRGFYTEHILEAYRKCWPDYGGYEALIGSFYQHSNAWPFDRITFTKNAAFKCLARVNWPLIAIPDYIAPNRYTNEKVKTNIHTVNNFMRTLNNVVFEFRIEKNGKNVFRKTMNVGTLAANEKRIQPFEFTTPSEPGEYRIVHTLFVNGKKETARDLRLVVRRRNEVFAPVKTAKKIALYDASAVFGTLKPYSTNLLLKAFKIPFTPIKKFDQLAKFDILIIGTESLDGKIQDAAETIRNFIKNGGRVLMFDQNLIGRVPFMAELKLSTVGPAQYSDVVRLDHSAMRGMKQDDFFCWNQQDYAIYRSYITPLSKAALMFGGDSTQWGSDNFGMVTAHLKFGKGDLLMTQCEVTKLINEDSAAALFARRLLETIINDKTRVEAQDFVGFPLPKNKPLKQKNAMFISLKNAANMGFADPVAKDGKGGWTDQGPTNDLYHFPVGSKTFGGVPFKIINPAENGGRSCIVQSSNPVKKFTPDSKPIIVNAKLKRLLFLHSSAWSHDKKLGEYIITYKTGRKVTIPLYVRDNIFDWWGTGMVLKNADCVWSGMNRSAIVSVFLYEWKNPFPQEEIATVVLSVKSDAVVGLIGLTGEKL